MRAARAEEEQTARKRVGLKFVAAQSGQRIDAFPAINGFDRN